MTSKAGPESLTQPDKGVTNTGSREKIADLLAMPGGVDSDFEIPPLSRELARPAGLS